METRRQLRVPEWEDPRKTLARHGLSPKRSFSQNFLVSRHVLEEIVAVLGGDDLSRVVELGAGLGTLTGALLRAGARVTAIERDRDMVAVLHKDFGGIDALSIVEADAAAIDYAALSKTLAGPLDVVGNLPYAITGAILRAILDARAHVRQAIVMVQREVGERLVAKPGTSDYGALTVFALSGFDVTTVVRVPKGAFHPPPKVESSVVRLAASAPPRAVCTAMFTDVVHFAFQARRKTLRNALQRLPSVSKLDIDDALSEVDINPHRRGETLSIEEFDALSQALELRANRKR